MDHVRLPVDYPVLEDGGKPGFYKESGFEYIAACLEWCKQNGLRTILDLHKAPGFAFDALAGNTLFESPDKQKQFVELWGAIAQRFANYSDDVLAFELLNEIVLPTSDPWNALAKRTVEHIRQRSPQRLIVIGGNYFNSADQLQNLNILPDANILYNFHFYLPLSVTHQKAPWIATLAEYGQAIEYPGQESGDLAEVLAKHPDSKFILDREIGQRFNRVYLQTALLPAVDFSRRIGQPVYCGEFGVYEKASMTTRLNWTRDFIALLNEFKIGRAYWTYKALDFGLVDKNGKVVNQELVEIAAKR
jgi:aryl-phospho-beta-D-glucosidase BglC (GH1 family)